MCRVKPAGMTGYNMNRSVKLSMVNCPTKTNAFIMMMFLTIGGKLLGL